MHHILFGMNECAWRLNFSRISLIWFLSHILYIILTPTWLTMSTKLVSWQITTFNMDNITCELCYAVHTRSYFVRKLEFKTTSSCLLCLRVWEANELHNICTIKAVKYSMWGTDNRRLLDDILSRVCFDMFVMSSFYKPNFKLFFHLSTTSFSHDLNLESCRSCHFLQKRYPSWFHFNEPKLHSHLQYSIHSYETTTCFSRASLSTERQDDITRYNSFRKRNLTTRMKSKTVTRKTKNNNKCSFSGFHCKTFLWASGAFQLTRLVFFQIRISWSWHQ